MRTYVDKCFLMIAAFALAACGGEQQQQEPARAPVSANQPQPQSRMGQEGIRPNETMHPQETTQEPALQQRRPGEPGMGTSTTMAQEPMMPADQPMTDAQIVAAAATLNEGEIQMAELAKKNASNAEVKQFALMMQQHHGKGLDKTKTIQSKAKISPDTSNNVTIKMKSETNTTIESLKDKTGNEFDRAYIDAQVKAHRDALDAIDNKMLPNAQNADLKMQLTEMRRQVAEHLTKAEAIQKKLEKTGSSNDVKK